MHSKWTDLMVSGNGIVKRNEERLLKKVQATVNNSIAH